MTELASNDILVSIIAGSVLLFVLCIFIVAFSALFLRKRQQHRLEKKQLQSEFAETLLKSQLEIKEQTLQHIAYELHDNLGQVASLIKINLNTLNLDDKQKAQVKVDNTKDLVRQLITDLKTLSISLGTNRIARIGIVKALETEIERLNKTGQFEAVLEIHGEEPLLDGNTTIILFRMVQEILNNIVKHSQAKRIAVCLSSAENLFTLVCKDNGIGFNPDEKAQSGGSGLMNLQSRAKLIHAQLSIRSEADTGTTVTIQLPT